MSRVIWIGFILRIFSGVVCELTLLREPNSVHCIASGDDSQSSALVWAKHLNETIESSWKSPTPPSKNLVNALSCDLTADTERCDVWKDKGLTRMSNLAIEGASELGPVLDHRWENFKQYYTWKTTDFVKNIKVSSVPDQQSISFSILADSNAHLVLHSDEDILKSSFYFLVIDGWGISHKTAVRKCNQGWPTKTKYEKKVIATGDIPNTMNPCWVLQASKDKLPLLSSTQWVHFTIEYVRSSDSQAQIKLWRGTQKIIEWTDSKLPIKVNYISFRTYNTPGYWRFHVYDVLRLNSTSAQLSLPNVTSPQPFCLSLTFHNSKVKGRLQVANTDMDLKKSSTGWQVARLETTLQPGSDHKLSINVSQGGQGSFLIGDVRVCSQNEVHVSTLKVANASDAAATTCKILTTSANITFKDNIKNLSTVYTSCQNSSFGAHCNLTCALVLGEDKRDCKKFSACNVTGCSCLQAGYTGNDCNTKCTSGLYGRGCGFKCGECLSGATCDHVTGVCPGGCERGFKTPFCTLTTYILFTTATELEDGFAVNITKNENVKGPPVVSKFRLEYKESAQVQWPTYVVSQSWPPTTPIIVKDLKGNTKYSLRVVLLDNQGVVIRKDEIQEVNKTTKCKTVGGSQFNVTTHKNHFTITLLVPVTNQICSITDYYIKIDNEDRKTLGTLPIDITKLQPYTEYNVTFYNNNTVIREGKFKTAEGAPGKVENLKVNTSDAVNAKVTWEAPNKSNGIVRKYNVVYEVQSTCLVNNKKCTTRQGDVPLVNTPSDVTKVNVATSSDVTNLDIPLSSLQPNSTYQVHVSAFTVEEGPEDTVQFTTPTEPDKVQNLTFFKEPGEITWDAVDNADKYDISYKLICKLDQEMKNCSKDSEQDEEWSRFTTDTKFKLPEVPFEEMLSLAKYSVSVTAFGVYRGQPAFVEITTPDKEVPPASANITVVAAASSVLLLLLVATVLLVLWFKKRGCPQRAVDQMVLYEITKAEEDKMVPQNCENGEFEHSVEWRAGEEKLAILPPNHVVPESAVMTEKQPFTLPPNEEQLSRLVKFAELEQYVEAGLASGEIRKQLEMFPRGQTQPWVVGRLPENKVKNRYGNLVAYDATRVKLAGDPKFDYINANYIDGYKSPRAFIATQGPKSNTLGDFWHMVWQEDVHLILAVANCVEGGKPKVEQYWPEVGLEDTFDDVTVNTISQEIYADYTFRNLEVHYQTQMRKVLQLHFTSWPDHGVPMYPQTLATYLKKIFSVHITGPVLVHCSAGVGRTGTVILAISCLRMVEVEGQVDPLNLLQAMRAQRPNMVDNAQQYELVHVVLLECLVTDSFDIECGQFPEQLRKMLADDRSILEQQFELLGKTCRRDAVRREAQGRSGRVLLSRPAGGSDYINAMYVDRFRQKAQFIATQGPQPDTGSDFWEMVVQTRAGLVLVLNQPEPTNDLSSCWPEANSSELVLSSSCSLELKHQNESKRFEYRKVQVRTTRMFKGLKESSVHRVNVISVKGWPAGQELPPDTDILLELWQEAVKTYEGVGPIVVTCNDGSTACGMFLSICFVVEKMKLEQMVDVGLAVRTARLARPHFVATLDQFEFIHKMALSYLDSFETYANFL